MPPSASVAILASAFINSLGINTHIDFNRYGYQDLAVVEKSLTYLGVPNVRDSSESIADLQSWQAVAQSAGVKFDDFMPEGSPANMQNTLSLVGRLSTAGILNYVEGGNEEDDSYALSMGNGLYYTAYFQQQLYQLSHSLALPVINMSFGAGWTPVNNWQGDYGAVGDLSPYADYGNAHTYPGLGRTPNWTMQRLNGLATLAAKSRPVITTEIGWNEAQGFSQSDVAKSVLNAAFDGWKNGDIKTYFYALYDDGAGRFGLMNQDGTPKPAGTALHNLTALLADTGANGSSFAPGSLQYQLSGAFGEENSILIQKSDGTYWMSIWDEEDGEHPITLTLTSSVSQIQLFDPLTSTNAIQTVSNATALTVDLIDHPLLIHVIPNAPSATAAASALTPAQNVITTLANNSTIASDAGTIGIYVYGSGNVITGGSTTKIIQAFKGGNTIYGGSGAAAIHIAGSNNRIFVGGGFNSVADSGTNNTITFGKGGSGTTAIYGYVLNQGDTFDFSPLLAGTQWTGDPATIGNFLKVTNTESYSIVHVDPSGLASGVTYPVAVLYGYAYLTLPALLAHSAL
ncbi:MAG: hypothetical protein EPO08_11950 [Rhodospirillaceae bacterium]|nr:MAG: hypothetical protein EPO08_11950 [Rhodospirillaceae bacterium]